MARKTALASYRLTALSPRQGYKAQYSDEDPPPPPIRLLGKPFPNIFLTGRRPGTQLPAGGGGELSRQQNGFFHSRSSFSGACRRL